MLHKISVVIRKHTAKDGRAFYGATARGRYLISLQAIDRAKKKGDTELADEINGFTSALLDCNCVVKITAKSGVVFPQEEGVFAITFEGEAWLDTRNSEPGDHEGGFIPLPIVRLDGKNFTFEKKCDLKPFAKADK